jgi:formylglycine-generating enzyme
MKRALTSLPAAIVLLFLVSAKSRKEEKGFDLREFEQSLAYIPAGSYNTGPSDQDGWQDSLNKPRTVSFQAFFMSKFEVSNKLYREFFLDLLRQGKREEHAAAIPDTMVWREKMAYSEPSVEYYLRHPAYSDYPVVGITYEQAEQFCRWLAERYMKEPKRKYKKAVFRLPTRDEWMYASHGGLDGPFPWKGFAMQNEKGQWMANFRIITQSNIKREAITSVNENNQTEQKEILAASGGEPAWSSSGKADITAPVNTYFPNGYGLYNMAGNVEEIVKEKGLSVGGSWNDTGYYLVIHNYERYDAGTPVSSERGFRFIMEVLN